MRPPLNESISIHTQWHEWHPVVLAIEWNLEHSWVRTWQIHNCYKRLWLAHIFREGTSYCNWGTKSQRGEDLLWTKVAKRFTRRTHGLGQEQIVHICSRCFESKGLQDVQVTYWIGLKLWILHGHSNKICPTGSTITTKECSGDLGSWGFSLFSGIREKQILRRQSQSLQGSLFQKPYSNI